MAMTETLPAQAEADCGNLDDAVAGRYNFDIVAVTREAWLGTRGIKRITIVAGLAVFGVVLVAGALLTLLVTRVTGVEHPGLAAQLIMQLGLMTVVYPFLVGFLMLGIRRAAELPVRFGTPFSYLGSAVPVIVTAILMSFLTTLGLFLLVVPGVYLSVAYLFSLPLVVDKGLGPWAAMEASRKAVTAHWFKLFAVFILFGILVLLGLLSVVGWIWTVPLWYAGYGVLYRVIFGVDEVGSAMAEVPAAPGTST
jgi:uncharacterized membrane protein